MSNDANVLRTAFATLVTTARSEGVPEDLIGRLALAEVLALWMEQRSWQDVASELHFTADNLDPDMDHEFMRP